MQSFKSTAVFSLLFSMALFVLSCGGNANTGEHSDHADHMDHMEEATTDAAAHGEGKEYTSAYVCPMHCSGSGSEETGTCPVCGMDYVAQAEHTTDGHMH